MEDYFFLPKGVRNFIPVTYNVSEHYDGGDFLTYPARRGWTEKDLEGHDSFGHRSDNEVNDFFQTWLYFGMAISVFAVADIEVTTNNFIFHKGNDTMATMGGMPKLLRRWHEQTCEWHPELSEWKPKDSPEKDLQWSRCKQVFDRAKPILLRFNSHRWKSEESQKSPPASWPVRPEVTTSIIAMAEILSYAVVRMCNDRDYEIYRYWGTSRLLKDWLSQKWCKFTVTDIIQKLQIDSQFYLAAASSPTGPYLALHADCAEDHCNAQVDETNYKTVHAPSYHREHDDSFRYGGHMDTDKVGWQPETFSEGMKEIVRSGGTPIVYWDEATGVVRTMSVNEASHSNFQYVAISHV
jgi:hypothetical protein